MREGVDFVFVTKEIIENFIERYACIEDDALYCFKRIGVMQDDGEVVCEM